MKLHLAQPAGKFMISAYGEGYVAVNGVRHERSLVVLPDRLVTDWGATTFEALEPAHLAALAGLDCEVLLLGTGAKLRFPAPALLRPLIEARIGHEVMDVQAACRTYNILMSEGRRVACALLLG